MIIYGGYATALNFQAFLSSADCVQNYLFQKFFQEHYQSVKRFRFRSGPTFCRSWSGSKLFAKVSYPISVVAVMQRR